MGETSSERTRADSRQKILARLAVLQRLRDEAKECGRLRMLESIEMLMQGEQRALAEAQEEGTRA